MPDRVRHVMANVFGVRAAEIDDGASVETLAGWDSLRHLELMLALEHEFAMQIPAETMLELTSLEAIVDYASAHAT